MPRKLCPFERKSSCYGRGVESGERQAAIVRRLQERGRVEVTDLASVLATSEVTVRRDLEELGEAGVLRRVRGGAVSLLMRGQELPFALREVEATAAKEAIAARAAHLVGDGEAVLLDGGTTTLALARRLAGRRLTVMALSLHHAGVLAGGGPDTALMLPGGIARPGELVLSGPLTESTIAGLRFDTAVLGGCGITAAGDLTTHDVGDAAVMRAAVRASRRTVLLADATKFARTAMVVVAPLAELDVVVTDGRAPAEEIAGLRGAGVEVLVEEVP